MKKYIFLFLLSICFLPSQAQDIEMADTFYSEGKVYVVVGVLLIILTGIFFYLFATERKLNRLEKELKK